MVELADTLALKPGATASEFESRWGYLSRLECTYLTVMKERTMPRYSAPSLKPQVSGSTMIGLVIGAVLIAAAAGVILGFSLMIFVGILFGEFGWLAPIGFGPAFGLAFFGSILLASTRAKVGAQT